MAVVPELVMVVVNDKPHAIPYVPPHARTGPTAHSTPQHSVDVRRHGCGRPWAIPHHICAVLLQWSVGSCVGMQPPEELAQERARARARAHTSDAILLEAGQA